MHADPATDKMCGRPTVARIRPKLDRTPFMAGIGSRIFSSQIWRSVIRHGMPRDRHGRALAVISNVFLHIHPIEMRRHSLRFWFTWGMGWLTFVLFLIEAVSGIALMLYYRPTAEHAYADMQALRAHVSFGLVREIHRWGAHAMVIAVWLHMLRVFLTGSYKSPREFNWGIGVVLLTLTMLLSFTGYLLPWDQLALWAVTVGTNMVAAAPLIGRDGPGAGLVSATWDVRSLLLGGSSVGPAALLRFYVLHCAALPVASAILIALHFWRIRKDGGISGPRDLDQPVHTRRSTSRTALVLALLIPAALILAAAAGSWSGLKGLANWCSRPEHLLPAAVGTLAVGLVFYRRWSRPVWAGTIGLLFVAGGFAAGCDQGFRQLVSEPDNIAITLMVLAIAGFLWLAAHRMAINDERLERGLAAFRGGRHRTDHGLAQCAAGRVGDPVVRCRRPDYLGNSDPSPAGGSGQSRERPQPIQGSLVFRGAAGTAGLLRPLAGRIHASDPHPRRPMRPTLPRRQPEG